MIETNKILKKFDKHKSNLIQILHLLQKNNSQNYLSEDDLKKVAEYLNISYSSVYGVVTYYSMFSLAPRGKNIIRLCSSPVCTSQNSCNIRKELKKILNIDTGSTTMDNLFTLEISECLGHCELAPVMMINEKVFGNLTPKKINSIFKRYK